MYLSNVYAENFRIFGAETNAEHLDLSLRPGLNVLVGENEAGKSAVVDAIRYVLWTTAGDYQRLSEDDFHVSGATRALNLVIRCTFSDLTPEEVGRYLEWLTVEGGTPVLHVTLNATRLEEHAATTRWRRNISLTVCSGKNGQGPAIEGRVREFLRTTYLRPLRDAQAELSAGRGSRLSQILQSHPDFKEHARSDFDRDHAEECEPKTIVGIMEKAENAIERTAVIQDTQTSLNVDYLERFSIGEDVLRGQIGVGRQAELRHILEKLDLQLSPRAGVGLPTPRGLGVNNVLFMATELLLLGGEDQQVLPLLLIEEPEAHLHPQMQLRLMEFLESRSEPSREHPVQMLVTTHSPNLASKVELDCVTVMCNGQSYPLSKESTALDSSDYRFLERFLDVTKANLFFAKAVVLVEGPSENILIPTFANLLGRSLTEHGVSIVNVGNRAFLRYARIFRRCEGREMPVRVACLVDRDIVPESVGYVTNGRKEDELSVEDVQAHMARLRADDGDSVRTFVSDWWTLEYDLARAGLAPLVHKAVKLAKRAKSIRDAVPGPEEDGLLEEADRELDSWQREGLGPEQIAARVYEPLWKQRASKPETAQFLAKLLERCAKAGNQTEIGDSLPRYIVEAVQYVTARQRIAEIPNATDNSDF